MCMDGQTDMMNLIVAFNNCVKASKKFERLRLGDLDVGERILLK